MVDRLGTVRAIPPALAFACLVILAGCSEFGWRGFRVDNRTASPVTVTATVNGSEQVLAKDLQPGTYMPITGVPGTNCVRMLLVARDPNGAEVARSDQDVCQDQTWIVRSP